MQIVPCFSHLSVCFIRQANAALQSFIHPSIHPSIPFLLLPARLVYPSAHGQLKAPTGPLRHTDIQRLPTGRPSVWLAASLARARTCTLRNAVEGGAWCTVKDEEDREQRQHIS